MTTFLELDFRLFPELGRFPLPQEQRSPGYMDPRVLWQDDIWIDVHGVTHALEDMSQEYLFNVLDLLFTTAKVRYVTTVQILLMSVSYAMQAGHGGSVEDFEEYCLFAQSISQQTPTEWLASTPLVKRLEALLEG